MTKHYEKGSYVHKVADFLAPRRDGHTNCGLSLEGMHLVPNDVVKTLASYVFCIKCRQLTGE